ncbi:PIG-L family deacetylase [Salegentibacter chungangensis]|uniref:PIG-L family deacetylase n=1 Tax=Salegentibacter chungangensis TaxID=1335724 RepID=A0ABW3NUN6_9FLAO
MRKLSFFLALLFSISLNAQAPEKLSSSDIYQKIKKLNFLGTVLYIAAHPDDENTRLISYFSNEVNARTGYLSITRGDGGQNLIGPEIREQLGIIRTQELLAARKIDGGEQFFTRANDFGYSKTPSETLRIWNKDKVLSDVVRVIRKFRPDVIINRFDHRTPGTTHGHHTSSAILSVEAFDLAGNKNAFKEQLTTTQTWQPERLFFNTSPWFYGGQEAFDQADKSNFMEFDTGVYFPLKGLSNPEIASISRSQHRSQGFGSSGSRGSQMEYLELINGNMPQTDEGIFAGIDTSWSRVKGGEKIGKILAEVEKDFDFTDPQASIPKLTVAYQLIKDLDNDHWRSIKTKEIKSIIQACAGLYLEAVAETSYATPGALIPVQLEAINRSDADIRLLEIQLSPNDSHIEPNVSLKNNIGWANAITLKIPKNSLFTSPYWLKKEHSIGMYQVEDNSLISQAETPEYTRATFRLKINETEIPFEKRIVHKYTDPVKGETYQPFEIVPAVSVEFTEDMLIFDNEDPKTVSVKVISAKDSIEGTLSLKAEGNWKIEPLSTKFNIPKKGGAASLQFLITPPSRQSEVTLKPEVMIGEKSYSDKLVRIEYPHFPTQTLVMPSGLKMAKLDIEKHGEQIGYIEGAGDIVPESLEQIGYNVTKLSPQDITAEILSKFDAVVIGIRAYNTVEELKFKQSELFSYVENGGTLITQYNTSRGLVTDRLSPFELKLSRDRVTEENAEVTFLAPQHPLLNYPNKITKKDFDGWVQERGLYFPDEWSEEFTPILSMHDQGESPKQGSLLVAKYGKGYYIYTGLSFFREFPAGVPGAYRLFANMISIGK